MVANVNFLLADLEVVFICGDYLPEQNAYITQTFVFPQSLFSAIIQNPMEKPNWLFVEGTRVMLTSQVASKNTSSLQHSDCLMHYIFAAFEKTTQVSLRQNRKLKLTVGALTSQLNEEVCITTTKSFHKWRAPSKEAMIGSRWKFLHRLALALTPILPPQPPPLHLFCSAPPPFSSSSPIYPPNEFLPGTDCFKLHLDLCLQLPPQSLQSNCAQPN